MSIYIITHKAFQPFTTDEGYKTLLVGAERNVGEPTYLTDNSQPDNISQKNASFCELTGAYWIWKHSQDEIVGLVHYRRFFIDGAGQPITYGEIESFLKDHDLILPTRIATTRVKVPATAYDHFVFGHGKDGKDAWATCKQVLREKYPDMLASFEVFEQQKSGYFYNMSIMKKPQFDAYCQWLFDILFEVEKRIDLSNYLKYNQRMFGFLSERLLTFWVEYHQLKVKEVPISFTEPPSLLGFIKQEIQRRVER